MKRLFMFSEREMKRCVLSPAFKQLQVFYSIISRIFILTLRRTINSVRMFFVNYFLPTNRAICHVCIIALLVLFCQGESFGLSEWLKNEPAGTRSVSDIDDYVTANNEAIDRLMTHGRFGCQLTYASVSTLTVGIGSVVCSNSAGTVRRTRSNSSTTTVNWDNIDTGAEEASTTYYVYAVADADAATFTIKISKSSSAPTGVTYYFKLGSFYKNSGSDIEYVNCGTVGTVKTTRQLGAWETKANNTVYLAETDGFVLAWTGAAIVRGFTDGNNPPTTERISSGNATGANSFGITMPVRKGDYWKVTGAGFGIGEVYWIPLGA
jgi:hypothetical protein